MFGPLLGCAFIAYVVYSTCKGPSDKDTRVSYRRNLCGRKYRTVSGPCFRCGGTGRVHGRTCRKCGGSGRFSQTSWYD